MAKAKLEKKFNKEQLDKINNYAKDIKTLENLMVAIRLRPTMYIGARGSKGFLNMIREIFQNSVDQIMIPNGFANLVIVSYNEIEKSCIIEDNGLGIPFDNIVRIFHEPHTGKNFDKQPGDFSAGAFGTGGKACSALSDYFNVESYKYTGEAREMKFEKGEPIYKNEKNIQNKDHKQGTCIEFKVDEEIMGDCTLEWQVVYKLLSTILSLSKKGATLQFNAVTKSGQTISETFVNDDGILTELIRKTTKPLIAPIVINDIADDKTKAVELCFTYSTDDLSEEDITSFANMSPTTGGTHVDGFLDGLCKFFRDYMNNIYLSSSSSSNNKKKNKITIVNADIKMGLKGMIHAKHYCPDLEGQSKERLTNDDMRPYIRNTILKCMDEWSKNNPKDLKNLCEFFKEIATERIRAEQGKEKISNKYELNSVTKLPPKFIKPSIFDEFIIVEGDSAGGTAQDASAKNQGVLPIRGKMPNAFSTTRAKFFENDEVKAFFTILGGGIGKNFDIKKVPWKKVIIGADADVDGLHISTLILQMVMLYCPDLIRAGKLYRAVPPLYGVNTGTVNKPKFVYYTDNEDYVAYVQKVFSKKNDIRTINKHTMSPKELSYILNTNIDYVYTLDKLKDTYSLDPLLLEQIVFNIDKGHKALFKEINKRFKYMETYKRDNTTILDGLIGEKINTVYLNDRFLNELGAIRSILDKNQFRYFNLNGNEVSLYQFMSSFEACKPDKVERYKGLGEMNGYQLKDSTLDPENRVLVRYTTESAKEEIEKVRYLESNKYELIAGVSATRHDL